jgi:hypothetical protein
MAVFNKPTQISPGTFSTVMRQLGRYQVVDDRYPASIHGLTDRWAPLPASHLGGDEIVSRELGRFAPLYVQQTEENP